MSAHRYVIMHLISTSFFGGPEKQIVEHLSRLNPTRYQGVLTSFLENGMDNDTLARASKVGLATRAIPMASPFDLRAYIALDQLLKQERVSLLCTHGYKATVMGVLAARRNGITSLAFSRGYTSENAKVAFYEWLERKTLEKANGIICVSNGQLQKLKSFGVQNDTAWVVHNCVTVADPFVPISPEDRAAIFADLGIPQNRLLIVTAGRLSPEKGHRFLVSAIAHVQNHNESVNYVFCGEGACLEDLKKQAQNLGLADRCYFVGFRRDLSRVFAAMDCLVLPSLTEGLPNVVLESFAEAKPVIASNVGGVPEIVINNVNGILVPPAQPALLADAIEHLIELPEERQRMGSAGRKLAKGYFSFDEQTIKIEAIYRQVLGDR